jgi:diguanylate cyclase (GGDEF)-like protein/PAS domain S-box-containing protein
MMTDEPAEALRSDDAWFREIAEGAGDVIFALRLRPDSAVEYVSHSVFDQLGYEADELIADPGLLARRVDELDVLELRRLLESPAGTKAWLDLRWVHRDGRRVWTQSWLRTRERADGSVVLEGTSHDITELREAEQARLVAEERYRLMAESANIVLWTMALDGSITYVSPTVLQMRGFTQEEAMHQPLDEILTPESQLIATGYYTQLYADLGAGRIPARFTCEEEYYCKDGSTIWTEVEVIPTAGPDGRINEILGITRDISERKRAQAQLSQSRDEVAAAYASLKDVTRELEQLSVTDPLTGVWNRRQGEQVLASGLLEASRYGTPMSLMMLDIDHFKDVNDTYGHTSGDDLLKDLTSRLTKNLRGMDSLARWGGDEFIIVTPHCDIAGARSLARKTCDVVADGPFDDVGRVTVSIGVAELWPDDDRDSWLGRVDRALFEAKSGGRNRFVAAAGD